MHPTPKLCPLRTPRSPLQAGTFSCSFLEAEILDFFCRGGMEQGTIRARNGRRTVGTGGASQPLPHT